VKNLHLALCFALAVIGIRLSAAPASPPGETEVRTSQWKGYQRLDFEVAGRPCLLVLPTTPAPGRPWIWRTEFFEHEPQAGLALLARGWHVAYMDAKNLYGAPKAIALFGRFYAHVVPHFGLARRAVLEGFSRGGLYAFNFAAAHPQRVAALYLDAPVLDIRSWPGRNRASKEWRECLDAYGLTEASLAQFRGNPLDYIPLVAAAKVPVLVVAGDADLVVPLPENAGILEKRYRELGGTIELIVKSGGGHHPHSLVDPAPIVEFLVKHARY
jgi:pimeloyl-ACP methyl ester carboxylesterase